MDLSELLAQAKPAERTVRLCLRGDLVAEWEDLDRKRAEAEGRTAEGSLAGSPALAIAQQMAALQEQMQASTYAFRVRALPRKAYQALVAAHPPRRDAEGKVVPGDVEMGVNSETFWDPLIRACLVDVDDEQATRLLEEVLSDRQFEQIGIACLAVCRGNVDIPFSSAVSNLLKTTGGESSAPNGSASPSNGSTAGSLATPSSTDPTDD